jgi:hypothetical protein
VTTSSMGSILLRDSGSAYPDLAGL